MFTLMIRKIILAGVPLDMVCILCNFVTNQKVLHFHWTQLLPFDSLFAIPTVVALSQWMGVLDCCCPNSSRAKQKIIPSLQFKKRAPCSASAAEATMKRSIAHSVKNAPFNLIGSLSLGDHPIKKCPHAQLWAPIWINKMHQSGRSWLCWRPGSELWRQGTWQGKWEIVLLFALYL